MLVSTDTIHGAAVCGANSEESIFRVIVGVKPKNKGTRVYMNNPRLDCDKFV